MNLLPRDNGTVLRRGLLCSLGSVCPVILLVPLATRLSSGMTAQRSMGLCVVLLATVYIMSVSVLSGIFSPKGWRILPDIFAQVILVMSCLTIAIICGAHFRSIVSALPGAAAVLVAGIGIGRLSISACRRYLPATVLAFVITIASAANLLLVSHTSMHLSSWPWTSRVLLSLNPFIITTNCAGYDLIRSEVLYDAMTISGSRFQYPGSIMGPGIMAIAGLALTRIASIITVSHSTGR